MTFPPSDSPDWTGIPGALRYLGTLDCSGNGAITKTLDFAPASYDGAVYVIPTGDPGSSTYLADVSVLKVGPPALTFADEFYYVAGTYAAHPAVSFVAAVLGTTWRIQGAIGSAVGSTWQLHCFAAPTYPLSRVASLDPRIQGTDMVPITRPLWLPRRQAADRVLFHNPAAATLATVTFPATAGRRWVLDQATWQLYSNVGAVSSRSILVSDTTGTLWQQVLSIPATAQAIDRLSVGPLWGLPAAFGSAMTVAFATIAVANTIEAVSAVAYLSEV